MKTYLSSMNFTLKRVWRSGVEPVSHETVLFAIIGDSIGVMAVTSMILRARRKVTRKGRARRARLILLSSLDQPCVGLNDWRPLTDAFGGGRYDYGT